MKYLWIHLVALLLGIGTAASSQTKSSVDDPLSFFFDGKRGQVEVGGPYVGMEFHESRPVPSRISFYYPVANSIDLSTDYWKRGESLPMAIGVHLGDSPVEWLQHESWPYVLSPHAVTFIKKTQNAECSVTYEFCKNQPASVMRLCLKNLGNKTVPVEIYTHLVMSLRTCQTYTRRDTSVIGFDSTNNAIIARFNYVDTDSAAVFVQNVGKLPVGWATNASKLGITDQGGTQWHEGETLESSGSEDRVRSVKGVAAYLYHKVLSPGDSLELVQVIGSCKGNEISGTLADLRAHWQNEIRLYDRYIREKAEHAAYFRTGDSISDRSAIWARALIAANAHYLDGHIVPMPCPAEYNFFFTHDLLLTNLGAVDFDLGRVKSNLLYVASMAKDSVIPHAYYWRDDGYKTEYCDPENWNHLWFVIVSGSYLRHSLDDSTLTVLYPYLTKSVHAFLTCLHPDGLMYAYRPDWWDIGHIEGPRTYLTALAARALEEYVFISSFLGRRGHEFVKYEKMAETMQRALVAKLWDGQSKYLTNYNAGEKDYHYYAGSLIPVVYNLLDRKYASELVSTATRQLVDERIGLRIAMPPDFSSDSVIRKYKFAGAEAGPPYSYANGGVWPHGNAWYAMALRNVGRLDDAFSFAKRTMTIDGIAESPNGLPAMYEYRSSDPNSSSFGKIDKPSFLWAGGMYLQVLYRNLAIEENVWNIGVHTQLPTGVDSVACSLEFRNLTNLVIRKAQGTSEGLSVDGEDLPTRIIPIDKQRGHWWSTKKMNPRIPVLVGANMIVWSVINLPQKHQVVCSVSSFEGHAGTMTFEFERKPGSISVDGRILHQVESRRVSANIVSTTLHFTGSTGHQRVIVNY